MDHAESLRSAGQAAQVAIAVKLRSKGEKQGSARALTNKKSRFCKVFRSALGRTRTCDLLIRSQTRSSSGGDTEGHRETKPRLYRQSSTDKGTGRDTGLWYRLWYES